MTATDQNDVALLGLMQDAVPLDERPFAVIGEQCGLPEDEVLARLRRLKEEKIIRQISAIFDTRSLGYASSLVAARVEPEQVDAAAAVLNAHPGVSHNYLRTHDYNLWYTIAVPPTSRFGLAGTVERLHALSGATETRLLPTLKLFKIGVRFDLGGAGKPDDAGGTYFSEADRTDAVALSALEREFVRVVQRDLALVPQPFVALAGELGIGFAELRAMHQAFLASGRMRRFAAVLHHRKAGFRANAMGVWAPDSREEAELDRLGRCMAGFRAVSHCYQRPTYPDWPFSLFTMVHGKSVDDCEATLAAIAEATGIARYQALYSTKEYKKVRVRYFTDAEIQWEDAQINAL